MQLFTLFLVLEILAVHIHLIALISGLRISLWLWAPKSIINQLPIRWLECGVFSLLLASKACPYIPHTKKLLQVQELSHNVTSWMYWKAIALVDIYSTQMSWECCVHRFSIINLWLCQKDIPSGLVLSLPVVHATAIQPHWQGHISIAPIQIWDKYIQQYMVVEFPFNLLR